MTDELDLGAFLRERPPFTALSPDAVSRALDSALIVEYGPGDLIVDGFSAPTEEVFVVLAGAVDLWFDANRVHLTASLRSGPGEIFGYSALLAARPIGPRAEAGTAVRVARIPIDIVEEAFATRAGARFLAEYIGNVHRHDAEAPELSVVGDLAFSEPVRIPPEATIGQAAARMSDRDLSYAVVEVPGGRYGLVTDAIIRTDVVAAGVPVDTPVSAVMSYPAPSTPLDAPVSEALMSLLGKEADILLATGPAGELRGAVTSRDFLSAPVSAGIGLHYQLRRAESRERLAEFGLRIPETLEESWRRGLSVDRVSNLYTTLVDTFIRRAIRLVFDAHPELSTDAFVWLSLGSNGRREALLSSDVDAAVIFDDAVSDADAQRYRAAFAEVNQVIGDGGIAIDSHGASTALPAFSRRNREWTDAARRWLAVPQEDKGIVMISLLADARPIHGDPGLPGVTRMLGEVRRQPRTLELLLDEALAHPARRPGLRGLVSPTASAFDVKTRGLLPIVNIARWASMSAGSSALRTIDRLRTSSSAGGVLTTAAAERLIEVFTLMEQLRLRHQLHQIDRGETLSDMIERDELTQIERRMVGQAIREIDSARRRTSRLAELGVGQPGRGRP